MPTFEGHQLRAVQAADVREWVADLVEEDYAPTTVRKAYQLLAQAMTVAVEDGLVGRSP